MVIVLSMLFEIGVRYSAIKNVANLTQYFDTLWNILDAIVVFSCMILFLVTSQQCSNLQIQSIEEIFEDSLLLVRNAAQFARLVLVLSRDQAEIEPILLPH